VTWDFCAFGIFNIFDKRENKAKEMKVETLKTYRAMMAFYNMAIIPIVLWSFPRAGFERKSDDVFGLLLVSAETVFERIAIPEITLEELVAPETMRFLF
jgi:hypothetical protein